MVVIVPHPTEELKIIRIQKALIEQLNDGDTICSRTLPLWISVPDCNYETKLELKDFSTKIEKVSLGEICFSKDQAYIPVEVKTKSGSLITKLPLLTCIKGNISDFKSTVTNSVEKLNIFRVACAEKLHYTRTSVQSSQTSAYVLKDSVWFKKSE